MPRNQLGVDIKTQMKYSLSHRHMRCVDSSLLIPSGKGFASIPERADKFLTTRPANSMQPAQHAFFDQPCRASRLAM